MNRTFRPPMFFVTAGINVILATVLTVGILTACISGASAGVFIAIAAGFAEFIALPVLIAVLATDKIVLRDESVELRGRARTDHRMQCRTVDFDNVRSVSVIYHEGRRTNIVILILSVVLFAFHDAIDTGRREYYEYVIHTKVGEDLCFDLVGYTAKQQDVILQLLKERVNFN